MIHRQLVQPRSIKRVSSLACAGLFSFLFGIPSGPATAGEFDRSTLPAAAADPAQCGSGSEASGLVKDSGDCKRISGYIAAGARFGTDGEIGGHSSPLGPLDAPEFVGAVRAAGAALIGAPAAGLGRIFAAPSPADEAR
jgi:hypothetical protein